MANILANSISNVAHLAAFDEMVEQRFANLDIEAVLIYMIDIVKPTALLELADQFDVLGIKGYNFTHTEQERRDLIKKAIELHRFKGTPWSVKEALKAIGYYDVIIEERFDNSIIYDGVHTYNGTYVHDSAHWADFRVTLDIGNSMGVDALSAQQAVALINEYKAVRCRLVSMNYQATLTDVLDITDELDFTSTHVPIHNGQYTYNGVINYGL